MPAYKFAGNAQPSVADFSVFGMVNAAKPTGLAISKAIRDAIRGGSAEDILTPRAMQNMDQMYGEVKGMERAGKLVPHHGRPGPTTGIAPQGRPFPDDPDPHAAVRHLIRKVTR